MDAQTLDEVIARLIHNVDIAAVTIDEVENELHDIKDQLRHDPPLSSVGLDEVFLLRELPGILPVGQDLPGFIRAVQDLPDDIRRDPMRSVEFDQLETILRRLDAIMR